MLVCFVKLEYEEMVVFVVDQVNVINIMLLEDCIGRGGDYIFFWFKSIFFICFILVNEYGNVDISNFDYYDCQYILEDILGIDINGDEVLDFFFVDFCYLVCNIIINGNVVVMIVFGL